MKKLLLYGLKYFNHFFNEYVTPEQEAESILKYLLLRKDIRHTLDINRALQIKLRNHMIVEKQNFDRDSKAIDKAYESDLKLINN